MTANTQQIQDKFAEIEAMLSNVDFMLDDMPAPTAQKLDYSTRQSIMPELAAFLNKVEDTTPTAPASNTVLVTTPAFLDYNDDQVDEASMKQPSMHDKFNQLEVQYNNDVDEFDEEAEAWLEDLTVPPTPQEQSPTPIKRAPINSSLKPTSPAHDYAVQFAEEHVEVATVHEAVKKPPPPPRGARPGLSNGATSPPSLSTSPPPPSFSTSPPSSAPPILPRTASQPNKPPARPPPPMPRVASAPDAPHTATSPELQSTQNKAPARPPAPRSYASKPAAAGAPSPLSPGLASAPLTSPPTSPTVAATPMAKPAMAKPLAAKPSAPAGQTTQAKPPGAKPPAVAVKPAAAAPPIAAKPAPVAVKSAPVAAKPAPPVATKPTATPLASAPKPVAPPVSASKPIPVSTAKPLPNGVAKPAAPLVSKPSPVGAKPAAPTPGPAKGPPVGPRPTPPTTSGSVVTAAGVEATAKPPGRPPRADAKGFTPKAPPAAHKFA